MTAVEGEVKWVSACMEDLYVDRYLHWQLDVVFIMCDTTAIDPC